MGSLCKPQRVDPGFEKEMRDIMKARFDKGLAKFNVKDLGMPEATRLIRRTENWAKVKEELLTKPKKESLFK